MFQTIDINELKSGDITIELDESSNFFELNDSDVKFPCRVTGEIRFSLMDSNVMARGKIKTCATLECVRCLEEFRKDIDFEFTIIYEPVDAKKETEPDYLGERTYLGFYRYDTIDAKEDIRQAILLELPDFPICDASCTGPEIQSDKVKLIVNPQEAKKTNAETDSWRKQLKNIKLS